ncbi:COPII coat assembly protein sec16 [Tolypocladium ophioglossoides CBS 100239]|uniref:Protein transport protein sec16 n=1 Tax=Tolypocladium ophioglossoides (strain CBS 100239) TaxID=1163406 RepID=A0A0L0NHE0_TOLOC|nr:COPII coat assembly protein sec16 [Tolypocladium ophioglossoides CBS 100239]
MADAPPSSSWHPAWMPNSHPVPPPPAAGDADATDPDVPAESTMEPVSKDATQHPESGDAVGPENGPGAADAWLSNDADDGDANAWLASDDAEPHADDEPKAAEAPAQQDGVDAWFSQDGGDIDGDAWLASEEAEPQTDAKAHKTEAQSQPDEDLPQTTTSAETGAPPTMAQHSSSMSFARTVSHEVSFNDDDDGDWNLTRSDTDTFGFMPSSNRTNSFPVVPPMTANSEEHSDMPLPSTQALDVMEETEREAEFDEEQYRTGSAHDNHPSSGLPERATATHTQWIGQETLEPEVDASEARYEEGIPLIPQSDATRNETRDGTSVTFVDPFAGNHGNDDDFSTKQEPGTQLDNLDEGIHPIERKSTMQVIGPLNPEPLSRRSTLEETLEEHEATQITESQGVEDATGISIAPDRRDEQATRQPNTEDLASKWQEAFAGDGDDDEFLLEDSTENKEIDATAFLGSDDEGFLEDDIDDALSDPQPAPVVSAARQAAASNPYAPGSLVSQQPSTSHIPSAPAPAQNNPYQQPVPAPFNAASQYGQPPQLRPELARAQSFADKSKGGYSSPYDLPTDLVSTTVKPRKRASMQQLLREQAPAPPRSTSMFSPGYPPSAGLPPAAGPASQRPPLNQKASAPVLRSQGSFFDDLPVVAKPRPSSRHSSRTQSPSPYAPAGQQPLPTPPMANAVPPPVGIAPQPSAVDGLVGPERVSPYAALRSSAPPMPPPSGNATRYSPTPAQQPHSQGAQPPAALTGYSPAPPTSRSASSHSPSGPATPSQAVLPHLPRTSSPLAHFEASSDKLHSAVHAPKGDAHHFDRRLSSSFEPRLNRVSSLPPTREVDEEEEEDASPANRSFSATQAPPPANTESRYNPAPPATARQTPPLAASNHVPSTLSPPKRAGLNYMPQTVPTAHPGFVPPPRASTQSPGAANRQYRPADTGRRPSSSHAAASPALTKTPQLANAAGARIRGQSLTTNMVPPTDGREHDPLERWKGVPIIVWGVGGTVVTSFPKSIPRYALNQTTPTLVRTCGEVKVRNIKDIEPLQDRLARFPGPLRGKSKKKEALTWLAAGIDAQEKELPDVSFHSQLSLEAKRGVERLLLWKLLRIFIDFDGTLEGNPAVEKAVRDVLSPGTVTPTSDNDALFPTASAMDEQAGPVTSMQADGADPAVMEQIRLHLLKGERETAVWSAVDKRLWGHAMLISHTVSPDLYKQVAQEFVRKEVNYPGHSNESIAALYKVLSGNFDDCVDELVPVHARAGLKLVSKESTSGHTKDAIDGLDKWRETLTLILSNRCADDVRGLNALGKLLSSYGRAEAAQVCFIFSRSLSVFGGLDDPNVDFVLLGSDHHQQSEQFAKETEALQLSEVYEYGLTLAGGVAAAAGAPHLAAYKLQHAVTLAEYGYRDKALQYCDAIAAAIDSQTRRSPYHHAILETAAHDFMTRLKQAPKDMSSSWMSKPSMNKVSDSVWSRFNKFVAGDEADNAANGVAGDADNGPFARIATTPNMSRPPSVSNFEVYGGGSPGYSANPPPLASASSSRYAPATAQPAGMANPYAPASQHPPAPASSGRNSNEHPRNAYEPMYPGISTSPAPHSGGYPPLGYSSSGPGYQPLQPEVTPAVAIDHLPVASQPRASGEYQQYGLQESPSIYPQAGASEAEASTSNQSYQPPAYGYEPPQMTSAVGDEGHGQSGARSTGGYEPPSFQPYSYEPPSYQPDPQPSAEDGNDATRPKQKSFMDDDEDDIPALRPQGKTKSEKDRENEEMFRKAAEEDAKRASAQQAGKKGWGFGGWFGGKKAEANIGEASPGKPIRAKLGEASSFVYDPELKRWINKKPGAENTEAKKATPPPPRGTPRSVSGPPPPRSTSTPPPAGGRSSVPPPSGPPRSMPSLAPQSSQESLGLGAPPGLSRSASNPGLVGGPPSGPPSRPTTSMSNASSIDDLLGAPAPRKAGQKKPRKSGRYVDVMAK